MLRRRWRRRKSKGRAMRSKRAEGPGERRAVRGGPFKNIEVEHPARLLETRERKRAREGRRGLFGGYRMESVRHCVRACVRTYVRACEVVLCPGESACRDPKGFDSQL